MVPVFASSFLQSVKAWNLLSRGMSGVVESLPVLCFFSVSYSLQFAMGCLGPCVCCPVHLHLRMSSFKFVEYLGVVGLEP